MSSKHGQKRSFPPGFARKSDGYFNDNNIEEKINEWRELSKKFKAEYFTLAETKQSLHTDYEKILDSSDRRKYEGKLTNELVKQNKQKQELKKTGDPDNV